MRDRATFDAYLEHAMETLRLSRGCRKTGDFSVLDGRDDEGQRLWAACLAEGWTSEEGEQALRENRYA